MQNTAHFPELEPAQNLVSPLAKMTVLENQSAVYSSYMSTGARRQKALLFDPPANEPYQTQAPKGDVIGLGGIAEDMHLQQGITRL
jgi:hypothetical protein